MEPERLWRKGFVDRMSFKSGVKGRRNDAESKGGECDQVICTGWGEPGEWTEWGWRNEEGSWFHRWGMHI